MAMRIYTERKPERYRAQRITERGTMQSALWLRGALQGGLNMLNLMMIRIYHAVRSGSH